MISSSRATRVTALRFTVPSRNRLKKGKSTGYLEQWCLKQRTLWVVIRAAGRMRWIIGVLPPFDCTLHTYGTYSSTIAFSFSPQTSQGSRVTRPVYLKPREKKLQRSPLCSVKTATNVETYVHFANEISVDGQQSYAIRCKTAEIYLIQWWWTTETRRYVWNFTTTSGRSRESTRKTAVPLYREDHVSTMFL